MADSNGSKSSLEPRGRVAFRTTSTSELERAESRTLLMTTTDSSSCKTGACGSRQERCLRLQAREVPAAPGKRGACGRRRGLSPRAAVPHREDVRQDPQAPLEV